MTLATEKGSSVRQNSMKAKQFPRKSFANRRVHENVRKISESVKKNVFQTKSCVMELVPTDCGLAKTTTPSPAWSSITLATGPALVKSIYFVTRNVTTKKV